MKYTGKPKHDAMPSAHNNAMYVENRSLNPSHHFFCWNLGVHQGMLNIRLLLNACPKKQHLVYEAVCIQKTTESVYITIPTAFLTFHTFLSFPLLEYDNLTESLLRT